MNIQHIGTSGVTDDQLQTHISRLSGYRDDLKQVRGESAYNTPESLLRLPEDDELLFDVQSVSNKLQAENLTDVIIVGIGGSVRGVRAVYDLVRGDDDTRLHTINTMDSARIRSVVSAVTRQAESIEQVAICITSKSGTTVETAANANFLLAELSRAAPTEEVLRRVVAITQPGSPLSRLAEARDLLQVRIPEQVSGRFSVFSAAGLLPLLLLGVDIEALRTGAKGLLEVCLSGRATADPAAALAAILYTHTQDNVRILNHCFFTERARGFGGWISQLYAESLGKRENRRGEPVFSGLYPVTTIAPEDLHADLQLQLAGAKNFFSIFIREQADGANELRVTSEGILPSTLSDLDGKSPAEISESLASAVMNSFKEAGRPFVSITVDSFSPQRVGQLLILEELMVMYLAHLLEVNAFTQPQIEDYKQELHKLLK